MTSGNGGNWYIFYSWKCDHCKGTYTYLLNKAQNPIPKWKINRCFGCGSTEMRFQQTTLELI